MSELMIEPALSSEQPQGKSWVTKLVVLALLATTAFLVWYFAGEWLTFGKLAASESWLRDYQSQYPVLVLGIAFLIYVTVTGLSLPGATVLSLTYAWYFGFWPGLVLISFASTTGATLAFLLSRYLFGETIQNRFADRLQNFNESFEREGAFFLFTLRLIPVVPFFVINAVMGLTSIRAKTFWWVSQVGMLPGTIVYVYAGSRVPNLQKLADEGINAVFTPGQMTQFLIAFALLGLFPFVARFIVKRFGKKQVATIGSK